MEELSESEIPGTIIIQRTSTNATNPITLEYKKSEEFNDLVTNNNEEVLKYFTLNDK